MGSVITVNILSIRADNFEEDQTAPLIRQSHISFRCLPISLQLSDALLHFEINCSTSKTILVIISGVSNIRMFTVP